MILSGTSVRKFKHGIQKWIGNLLKVAFYYGGAIINTYNSNPVLFLACEASFDVSIFLTLWQFDFKFQKFQLNYF